LFRDQEHFDAKDHCGRLVSFTTSGKTNTSTNKRFLPECWAGNGLPSAPFGVAG
jgi:hypothetical protein